MGNEYIEAAAAYRKARAAYFDAQVAFIAARDARDAGCLALCLMLNKRNEERTNGK